MSTHTLLQENALVSDQHILQVSRRWAAGDSTTWYRRSKTLFEAARRLAEPFPEAYAVFQRDASGEEKLQAQEVLSVSSVHLMLCGLAVELLLKARLVEQGRPVLDGDEKMNFPFNQHDLERLAKEAKVPLTSEQCYLLRRLTAFSVWAGRYPIAKKAAAHLPVDIQGGGRGPINHVRSRDMEAVAALYSYIEDLPAGDFAATPSDRFLAPPGFMLGRRPPP